MSRPTQALIDLNALKHNYRLACSLAPASRIMPVVKANAYGHGAAEISKALTEENAVAFAVACIEEAIELRNSHIQQPILLLQGQFTRDEIIEAANKNFWLMIGNQPQLDAITNAQLNKPVRVWLKVDTGMHRLGITPDELGNFYQRLKASSNVHDNITIATHFACADELDDPATQQQTTMFKQVVADINTETSLANSAAMLGWRQTHADWNRPGLMLYGTSPFSSAHSIADQLKTVMTLKSQVISVRDINTGEAIGYSQSWRAERPSRIATITIGYADGYPRHAPNGTPVLINGQRAPMAGRVSMDMITVDVTDLPETQIGDEAILWGNELPVNEVAEHAGTISYELLARMPMRTPRVYID